jgi:benzoylformate decarboxylase
MHRSRSALFDHLVGDSKRRWGNGQAERLCCLNASVTLPIVGKLNVTGRPLRTGVGIGLATGKHAVCFVGDGGSLFSIHALRTAAKYAIPSTFVCFVNHEYRLLKDLWCQGMGATIDTTRFVGRDFDDPKLDMQGIASGFGARMDRIDKISAIDDVLDRALTHRGPSFPILDREP